MCFQAKIKGMSTICMLKHFHQSGYSVCIYITRSFRIILHLLQNLFTEHQHAFFFNNQKFWQLDNFSLVFGIRCLFVQVIHLMYTGQQLIYWLGDFTEKILDFNLTWPDKKYILICTPRWSVVAKSSLFPFDYI